MYNTLDQCSTQASKDVNSLQMSSSSAGTLYTHANGAESLEANCWRERSSMNWPWYKNQKSKRERGTFTCGCCPCFLILRALITFSNTNLIVQAAEKWTKSIQILEVKKQQQKLVSQFSQSIKFFMNLTPLDEGDEVVDFGAFAFLGREFDVQ